MRDFSHLIIFIILCSFLLISCQHNKKVKENESVENKPLSVLDQIDELNKKIRADSLNAELFHMRAQLYYENEEYNAALIDIGNALGIDSVFSGFYITLSDIYVGLGKIPAALVALEESIKLDAKNSAALLKLSELYIIFRDYKKALGYIDQALGINDLDPKAYFLRGVVLLENNDTVRGIRNFQKAIDVDNDYFDAHLQLGMLYAGKKNKLAVDYLNNALNIDPGNKEVTYYIALYYQETNEYDKAIQFYNSILDDDPNFYFALYNIGYINMVFQKDFNTAVDYFTQTIEINPEYIDAFYNRGFAYELLKDIENSRKDYKRALELSPNYEKAVEGLNRIDDFLIDNNN
ncbi:MAG: tetratricopeptide repeat protein [Bacteroidales bacterium]|nr:tetratricopeptide repeat protein [Bacteroidales bacterium]